MHMLPAIAVLCSLIASISLAAEPGALVATRTLSTGPVEVTLPAKERETILDLLEALTLPKDRVAIEHNREILPRARFADVVLKPDDRLEIVHFVGGG